MTALRSLWWPWTLAAVLAAQDPPAPEPPAAQDPDAISAARAEAFRSQRAGDHGTAAEAFLRLCELEPDNPAWVTAAADSLGKVGRFNDAMDLIESRRQRFPDVVELPLMLARLFHLKADTMVAKGIRDQNVTFYYQDAARTAEALLAVDPKHYEARLLVASARYQLGDFAAGLEIAEQVVADHPDAYGGHAMVGRIRFQQFLDGLQRRDREHPSGKELQRVNTEIYGHQHAATLAFQAAAEADPDRSFPQVKLGDIAAWTGRTVAATACYERALSIEPAAQVDHGWLRNNVAADKLRPMYEGAAATYRGRDNHDAKQAALLDWYIARTYFDAKDWKTARARFEVAFGARPEIVDSYYYLVVSCYWAGDVAASGKWALEFAAKDPQRFADLIRDDEQTVSIIKGMADYAYKHNVLPPSRDLNRVLAYAAQTVDAWNNYAFLARETGEYEASYAAYENALSLDPDSPQLLNDAAVILQYHLQSEQNLLKAKAYYERAIENARARLASADTDGDERARCEQAIQDATGNLAAMGAKPPKRG